MLTMMILFVLTVGFFRVMGWGLRICARVIAWMIGAAVAVSLIGLGFAALGLVFRLAFRLLPFLALIGLGVFIGRRIGTRSHRVDALARDTRSVIDI